MYMSEKNRDVNGRMRGEDAKQELDKHHRRGVHVPYVAI